jgi:hypothetical protein
MVDQGISVLVLYENFAVATVVLRRLLDMPMVHMVRADSVSACNGHYDVVVVDPYLRAHRRAEVLRRWAGSADPEIPIIELCDLGGGTGAEVLAGQVASGPGQAVMSALRLESAAA